MAHIFLAALSSVWLTFNLCVSLLSGKLAKEVWISNRNVGGLANDGMLCHWLFACCDQTCNPMRFNAVGIALCPMVLFCADLFGAIEQIVLAVSAQKTNADYKPAQIAYHIESSFQWIGYFFLAMTLAGRLRITFSGMCKQV